MSSSSKSKSGKNHTFVALTWVRDLTLSTSEKAVLYSIASRIGSDYTAWPSRKKLGQDAGIKSLATVSKTTQCLEDKGLIKIIERIKDDGAQTSNQYLLLIPPQYKGNSPPSKKQHGGSTKSVPKQYNDNHPPNYTGGIEFPKEETGDGASASLGCALDPDLPPGLSGEEFPISVKYAKNVESSKALVCFWWDLIQLYRDGKHYPPSKLNKYQFKALMELSKIFKPRYEAFFIIEYVVRNWDEVKKSAKTDGYHNKPNVTPTTTWINKNIDVCAQLFNERYK